MAVAPVSLNYSHLPIDLPKPSATLRRAWLPVFCALGFICFTSTSLMGGSHTQIIVNHAWHAIFGNWHYDLVGKINGDGRKVGHFFGYGTVGLLFRRAWHTSMRAWALAINSKLALFSASLGIASTFGVASLDEWHQRFLAGRVGTFHDVMLDTCGAFFLNLMLFAYRAHKRGRQSSSIAA